MKSPPRCRQLVTALLLLLLVASRAAGAGQPDLYAGLKAGSNFSWITGDTWEDDIVDPLEGTSRGRFGVTGGGFVTAVFPSLFGFRAELLYAERGALIEDIYGMDAENRLRVYFLDLSLLVERHFPLGPGALSLFLGPSLLMIQGDLVSETTFGDETSETRDPVEDEQLFGATGGLGYSWLLGPGALVFEARYTRGLEGYNEEDAFDNSVTVLTGYAWRF